MTTLNVTPGRRRRAKPAAGTGTAAWGYYAATVLPKPQEGGTAAGLVTRSGVERAFWAVWSGNDPRREAELPPPDDFGFVEGSRPLDEAVGAAYSALRTHRGRHVYDICVGEALAIAAYREGAPVKRSSGTDFAALAELGRELLGLEPGATPKEIKTAWRAYVVRVHPDQGGQADVDLAFAKRLYEAAFAQAERAAEDALRATVAAGGEVVDLARWMANVRTVAKRVRGVCEGVFGALAIEGRNGVTMAGWCTVAAVGLTHALREAGIEARVGGDLYGGAGHWWAEAIPGTQAGPVVVDVTASQFKRNTVVVAPEGSAKARAYVPRARTAPDVGGVLLSGLDTMLLQQLPPAWWRGVALSETQRQALSEGASRADRLFGTGRPMRDFLARVP